MSKASRELSAMIQRQPTYTAPELDPPAEAQAAPKKRGPKPKPRVKMPGVCR